MEDIRNIAIIAHVDHGKTTLVDQLLLQSGTFRPNQKIDKRVMDSIEIEREKGITICSKNAAFRWKNFLINVVDTPGHADFGGEVERVMQTVDGVLLVVDAHDGPQAQTKFVLQKALTHKLKPIVVINKIDRENARPNKVLDMVFELFLELNVTDEQLDFPHVYTSAKAGFAKRELDHSSTTMEPLFEAIVRYIPPPHPSAKKYFQFLVTNLDHSAYLGRIAWGRVVSGTIRVGRPVFRLCRDGRRLRGNVAALLEHEGLEKIQIQEAVEGHIVGLSGFENVCIGETITELEDSSALTFVDIDPLTISMRITVNDSPMAGKEGKFLTARHIHERLVRETRTNISLKMLDTGTVGHFEIRARGEMQVAVLAEQMRREGYELVLSRPEAVCQRAADAANLLEPFETVHVDVPLESLGHILKSFSRRKAEVVKMQQHLHSIDIEAVLPTRGLIGLKTELVSLTRGRGVMTHLFREYGPHKGEIPIQRNGGALISMETGTSTGYALSNIQERGRLFIGPQEDIYVGMIVGEHSRPEDLTVNPCKVKHLTNMRSQGEGKCIRLDPPVKMDLEQALEFIGPDEYVEVTPSSLRLRKKSLGMPLPYNNPCKK
ncbi:MAG: translational GTPase TypA [Candidatus Xiphinematobacter sp.]|nr:MAG: translational GTPase TypA [Candidatus Xiphinematobacter sp.]